MTATRTSTRTKTRSTNEKTVATEKSNAETATKTVPSPGFDIKILHKKALSKLLCCHHGGGDDNAIALTYPALSFEIGIGEKTKAWQCVAWKDLKSGGYIVAGAEPKTFVLSKIGVALATSLATPDELADFKLPTTNEELHQAIRKRLAKNGGGTSKKGQHYSGAKIFDLLLRLESDTTNDQDNKDHSFLRIELASKLGSNPESHGFYYGFKALEKMKLVSVAGTLSRDEFVRRATEATANMAHIKNSNNKATIKKEMATNEGEDGCEALETMKLSSVAGNGSNDELVRGATTDATTNISNSETNNSNNDKAIKKEKEHDETDDDDSKVVKAEKSGGEEEEKDETTDDDSKVVKAEKNGGEEEEHDETADDDSKVVKAEKSGGEEEKDDETDDDSKVIKAEKSGGEEEEKDDEIADDDSKLVKAEKSGGEEEEKDEPQPQQQQRPKRKRKETEDDTKVGTLEDPSPRGAVPKKKDPKTKKVRIRGGPSLFRLSERAFLTKSSTTTTK